MKKILHLLLLQISWIFVFTSIVKAESCGEIFKVYPGNSAENRCQCDATNNQYELINNVRGTSTYCCGVYANGKCRAYEDGNKYACGETNGSPSIPDGASCNCPGGQWESYWQSKIFGDQGACCGWTNEDRTQCLSAPPQANEVYCGTEYDPDAQNAKKCVCSNQDAIPSRSTGNTRCCGWYRDGQCQNTDVGINDIEVSAATLESLNPFKIGGSSVDLSNPGKIISRALQFFIFPIAGIILFVVMLLGGFQMLSGANNSKSLDEGKQKITSAIIGFIILFAAYWIAQLLEIIFGIRILS